MIDEQKKNMQKHVELVKEDIKKKSAILTKMAHDIKAPLADIIGYSELIGRTQLDKGQIEIINNIKFAGDTLATLVDNILNISELDVYKPKSKANNITARKKNAYKEIIWKKQPRILIVDDYEMSLIFASKIISSMGCKTYTAQSGAEAISMFSEKKYDMIFIDLEMPVMGGRETVRKIRKLEKNDVRVPIIMLSATPLRRKIDKITLSETDDNILKPFEPLAIYVALKKYLKGMYLESSVL